MAEDDIRGVGAVMAIVGKETLVGQLDRTAAMLAAQEWDKREDVKNLRVLWTGAEFTDWLKRMKWTDVRLHQETHVSRKTIAKYRKVGPPLVMRLACLRLEFMALYESTRQRLLRDALDVH